MRLVCFALFAVCCVAQFNPPLPTTPSGFNIHCDVCETMVRRTVPYCERGDQNLDFLPDFCTFNYNRVLREECDYIMKVMDYAFCPSACESVRKLKSYTGAKICHNPLVNCTERALVASPSVSPSPSPSAPIPSDCVLCEFVLKHVAIMCMNNEHASSRNIYHVCMEQTKTKLDFEHCQRRLHELVDLAGTEDPCTMLSCAEPKVQCRQEPGELECHVKEYSGNATLFSDLGMDKDGNLLTPISDDSIYSRTAGLGPGDFRPGQSPYHSLVPKRARVLPARVRTAGHLTTPMPTTTASGDSAFAAKNQDMKDAVDAANADSNDQVANSAEPTPIPLKDIQMQ